VLVTLLECRINLVVPFAISIVLELRSGAADLRPGRRSGDLEGGST
jgi:hypothetical protein